MLDIEVFSGKDIQNCMTVIDLCLQSGITDGVGIKKELEVSLRSRRLQIGVSKRHTCPQCGRVMHQYTRDRVKLMICTNGKRGSAHVGCQYSEVVK